MTALIWDRLAVARRVATRDGALPPRGLPLPVDFPSGYIEFCEFHAQVMTLTSCCDALNFMLRRPMVAHRGGAVPRDDAVA